MFYTLENGVDFQRWCQILGVLSFQKYWLRAWCGKDTRANRDRDFP